MKKILSVIKNSRGVTYIELLLYMALLGIFLFILTDMFISVLDVQTESQSTSSIEQNARYILARFNYDISRAEAITIPTSLGATADSLAITINNITNTYSLNSNNLQLAIANETNNLNDAGVKISDISFQRIGNSGGKDTVKLQFRITSKTIRSSGIESKTFQTTIGRR